MVLENERRRLQLLNKHSVDAAGAHWVETVSDSIFENSRMGDDELWGTALVDGDGRHLVEFVGATVLKQLSNRLLCHELLFFSLHLACITVVEQHGCWRRRGRLALRRRKAWLLAACPSKT